MNYFIIPGNPPATYFYELWCKEIEAAQAGSKTMVSRYPLLPEISDSAEAMRTVLKIHQDQLKEFVEQTGSPCTVIGHSLGGFFAMGLLEQAPNLVSKAILLHPFLRSPSKLGKFILKTASHVSYRPKIQQTVLRIKKNLEILPTPLKHITDEESRIALQLARHEEATIARDRSPMNIHSDHEDKITVFHANKDTWCGPESISDFKRNIEVTECLEPHAFIINKKHRKNLFKRIRKLI